MPVDLSRIIDYQLYLATQRYIAPYNQGRRTNNASPGCHRTTPNLSPERRVTSCDKRSSLGSLLNPWSTSIGSGSGSGGEEAVHTSAEPLSTRWGRSPADPSVTVTVGDLGGPVIPGGTGCRRGVPETKSGKQEGTNAFAEHLATSRGHPSFDSFVTAPNGDIDSPVVSGCSDRRVTETETRNEKGVTAAVPEPTAHSTRDGLPADTLFGPDLSNKLINTAELQNAPQTRPETPPLSPSPRVQPQQPAMASLASPNDLQLPNQLSRVTAITLLVEDLALTKRFYEQVFTVEPIHEDKNSAAFLFNDGTLIVNLYMSFDASDNSLLGDGVQVGRMKHVGRRFQLSVAVGDVHEVYARLRRLEEDDGGGNSKGKERALVVEGLTEPRMRSWGVRTIFFQDPSGHCWEVTEEAI